MSLCRLGLGPGLGLSHPRVTLGPPKGHPSATQGFPKGRMEQVVLFATKVEKGRVGGGRKARLSRGIAVIAVIARDRKSTILANISHSGWLKTTIPFLMGWYCQVKISTYCGEGWPDTCITILLNPAALSCLSRNLLRRRP